MRSELQSFQRPASGWIAAYVNRYEVSRWSDASITFTFSVDCYTNIVKLVLDETEILVVNAAECYIGMPQMCCTSQVVHWHVPYSPFSVA